MKRLINILQHDLREAEDIGSTAEVETTHLRWAIGTIQDMERVSFEALELAVIKAWSKDITPNARTAAITVRARLVEAAKGGQP